MLEGLEVSVLKFCETFTDNSAKRLDAEYFKKEYLNEDKQRSRIQNKYLCDISFITDGQHGYHEVDDNSPIRHLKAQNFKNWFAVDNNAERIAKWVDDKNKRSSLEENDIVLTTRGTVGYCAIVKNNVLPANIDQDVARIKLNDHCDITPQYLLTYINSRFGQDWTKRNQTGMVQQGLSLWRVREFPIPILSNTLQQHVTSIIEDSKAKIDSSNSKYTEAENLLFQEIGLQNFDPSQDAVNIKSFKGSFLTTKRLDAEYYQKKYEEYLSLIYNYRIGFEKLASVCNLKDNNFTPSNSQFYKYIELSNIGKSGEVTGCTEEFGKDLPSRARRIVSKGDVVISSIEGSLQSCAIISEAYDKSLCSTGFYVINSDRINSETLLVLFKSEPLQAIMKQNCSGTILTAMNKDEFLNIPIPLIDSKKQKKIADLVEESFKLKRESERLLEVAKKAVEIAIETDEKTAIKFIKDNN